MSGSVRERRQVSEYALLLHRAGWVANHDGNVSLRSADGFSITPTAVSKRLCSPESIVSCDMEGRPRGRGKPPSEVLLHVSAYRSRPEIRAVMHAHPPHATAFSLAGRSLETSALPEAVVSLGSKIPMVPTLLSRDPALPEAVRAALAHSDVALLGGNGVLTAGPDLETAYLRMELIEHLARITSIALSGVGPLQAVSADQMRALMEQRAKAGLVTAPGEATAARVATLTRPGPGAPAGAGSELRMIVVEEVNRALGGKS